MRPLIAGLLAAGLLAPGQSMGQEEGREMEALPPHLAWRVEAQDGPVRDTLTTETARSIYKELKRWKADAFPLHVCFFGGSKATRARIAGVAKSWEVSGTAAKFDFGDPSDPRQCPNSGGNNQIRIGFAYKGYWSMVGQDSYNLADQGEQSMNFARYNVSPPPEPDYSQTILHEFGHALGLEHEHQSPFSTCENDFDWPYVEAYLGGSPNFWDPDTIRHNMRRLDTIGLAGTPDNDSIMKYFFEPAFYKQKEASPCYSEQNDVLSAGDRAAAAIMYPVAVASQEAARESATGAVLDGLQAANASPAVRLRALRSLDALTAPTADLAGRRRAVDTLLGRM